MKYELRTALIVILLFVVSQFVGIYVVSRSLAAAPSGTSASSSSMLTIPIMVVVSSAIFLILYRMNMRKILLYWYYSAYLFALFITFSFFMNEWYALIVASGLLAIKLNSNDIYFYNLCEMIMYGGISSVFVPLLNLKYAAVLLIIMSAYDYFAVFISKHMIALAKTQFSMRTFSGIKVRAGREIAILGGGDVIFPLIFAGVVLRDVSPLASLLVIYGSAIGLFSLMLLGRRNKFYPAMPFLSGGCMLGLFIYCLSL